MKDFAAIETRILAFLRSGPMKQTDIVDAFPLNQYMDVGDAVRNLARRGAITRERCGSTYWVTLPGNQEG